MIQKLRLPGLIDIHTHLRTPGQTQKEDFYTGTLASLNGGFTTIIDMPNNLKPITSGKLLNEKMKIAKKNIVCDIGFHFGSLGDNLEEFSNIHGKVFGLKLYLNQTTGNFIIGKKELSDIYNAWESNQPILLHAEEDILDTVFEIIKKTKKRTHICHVSSKAELSKIIKAKEKGLPVTCGVTPHHLFLTKDDEKRLGPFGKMKPYLKDKEDVKFLWKNLKDIDLIESDHAPHTKDEKDPSTRFAKATARRAGSGQGVPFGVPGLDTTLSLLLTAYSKGKITIDEIVRLCHTNPVKIFNIPVSSKTFIEIEMVEYILSKSDLKTKCGWSPFEGMKLVGRVKTVVKDGKKVMKNGKITANKGSGKIIFPVVY